MGIFGRKPVGTDMAGSVLGAGIGVEQANAMNTGMGSSLAGQMSAQQQAINRLQRAAPRYLSYNINVRETSNGYVITLGEIVRVCATEEGKLLHEIGAAIGEYMLSIKEGER